MLLPGVLQRLVAQFAQPQRDPTPRRMRHDDLVDKALGCGHERVGEARLIFLGAFGDLVCGLAPEDDLDRALGAHHRDFGGGPGVVEVAAQVL